MTKKEIKALINEKIVANTSGNITAEVLNDILQKMLYAEDVEPTFTACYGFNSEGLDEEYKTNIGDKLYSTAISNGEVYITGSNLSDITESDFTTTIGTIKIDYIEDSSLQITISVGDNYGNGNLYYKSTLLCKYTFEE